MKKLLLFVLFIGIYFPIKAQTFKFPVDTLVKTGSLQRRINAVILPDGYTEAEMAKFKTDANTFINYLLKTSPFDKYKPYFSFFTVMVPSAESGITHPGNATDESTTNPQPVETKNTFFGTSFDIGKIHRLVSYTKSANLTNVLATNFPAYDIVFVIANTTYYGGAGGFAATFTLNGSSNEIGVHELGHSFASLSDEYYAGAIYEREALNMTKDKNPETIRWKNWLNTPNIGIFDHVSPGQAWAKPSTGTCRMEFLNKQFCSVCREGIVEKILSLINPVESRLPAANAVMLTGVSTVFRLNLLKPEPNSLQVEWFLDGKSISAQEQIQLNAVDMPNPTAKLVAAIYDSTFFSRNTSRKLKPYTLEWNLSRGSIEPLNTKITNISPQSLCPNNPITVAFTTEGNVGNGNIFTLQLSDNQGQNFKNLATTVDGSTLKATVPAGTPAGAGYKVRITSSNPAGQGEASPATFTVKPLPTAAFETKDLSIQQYTSTDAKINLTGDAPWKVGLSDGKMYDAAASPLTVSLAPNETTEYRLASVNNVCGLGTVSTTALKITVIPVLSINPTTTADLATVYPNPTQESVTILFSSFQSDEKTIELVDNQGKMLIQKTVTAPTAHLSLKDFPAGTYLLRIQHADEVITKKVIKQ